MLRTTVYDIVSRYLLLALAGHVYNLAKQELSVNVIETALKHGSETLRSGIISELIANHGFLTDLIQDKVGAYTVKHVFTYCNDTQAHWMAQNININMPRYTRQTHKRWLKILRESRPIFDETGRAAVIPLSPPPHILSTFATQVMETVPLPLMQGLTVDMGHASVALGHGARAAGVLPGAGKNAKSAPAMGGQGQARDWGFNIHADDDEEDFYSPVEAPVQAPAAPEALELGGGAGDGDGGAGNGEM
jgi:hypothetical protein